MMSEDGEWNKEAIPHLDESNIFSPLTEALTAHIN
jgi:hypothetical protein